MEPSKYAAEFADKVTEKFMSEPVGNHVARVSVMAGPKYDRLVIRSWIPDSDMITEAGAQRFAYAFVERSTGLLCKTGGWAGPAKKRNGMLQSRFSLSTPEGMAQAVEAADQFGGFLYVR